MATRIDDHPVLDDHLVVGVGGVDVDLEPLDRVHRGTRGGMGGPRSQPMQLAVHLDDGAGEIAGKHQS